MSCEKPTMQSPPADLTNEEEVSAYIKEKIRVYSNFPKPGAEFSDVTSLLLDPIAFQVVIDALKLRYADQGITHVVSTESRGFIFGAPLALALQAAFVPVRRARRLPGDVVGVNYVSGYYSGRMEVHQDAIPNGGRVVIIDDLVASMHHLKGPIAKNRFERLVERYRNWVKNGSHPDDAPSQDADFMSVMAEVVPKLDAAESEPQTQTLGKRGPSSTSLLVDSEDQALPTVTKATRQRFTPGDDLLLVKFVKETLPFRAKFGAISAAWEDVATKLDNSPEFSKDNIKGPIVRYRFENLVSKYRERVKRNNGRVVGPKGVPAGELEVLLTEIVSILDGGDPVSAALLAQNVAIATGATGTASRDAPVLLQTRTRILLTTMCCPDGDDCCACLAGMCCASCCLSAASSTDNDRRDRRDYDSPSPKQVYVQPVVVQQGYDHSQRDRIDVDKVLGQVRAFCTRAATYSDGGILIAVGLPEAIAGSIAAARAEAPSSSAFTDSVREFMTKLQSEVAAGTLAGKVEIIPMLHWGKFVPALNALIGTAADHFPQADTLILQSLEIDVDTASVASLRSHFDVTQDLVVGAALPGHDFHPDPSSQPVELSGLTSPWNTLALWNLEQLTKVGFALMGDALRLEVDGIGSAAGIEEVATIALYQQLYANGTSPTTAKLVRRLLGQLREFCARAATYADGGILIAVGLPAATTATMTGAPASGAVDSISPISSKTTSVFVDSVREFMARLQKEVASGAIAGKVEIIPLLFWGKFVPALNALIGIAADQCPEADMLLLQSLEIEVDAPGVALLRSNLDLGHDLVVGAALPGHAFQPDPAVQPLELSGLTSPWNTLALWNLQQLTKIGFALMGDALRLEVEGIGPAGGDEEVSSISMYQQLFTNTPAPTRAKLIRVPGVVWQVADFKDPERVAWHAMKMRSKKQRTAVQMAHFGGVAPGRVYHIEPSLPNGAKLQYRFAESQLLQIDHCILLILFVHGSNLRHCDRHYSNKYGIIQRPLEAKQQTTLRQQQRMNSGDGIQTRAASLRQEATRRWLVKDELVFLLLHHKLVGVPILHSLQLRPPSRSRRRVVAKARMLTRLSLPIGGSLLFYNTLRISDYKKDGWHWQKRKDKSGRVREDRAKLVINREVIILGTYVHSAETSTSSFCIPDADLLLLKDSAMEGITTGFGADDLFNDLASATSPEKDTGGLGGQQTFELVEISDFSPDWDFGDGGAKVLICLAAKLPKRLTQDPIKLFVQFGAKRVRAEKVSDTVLRCTGAFAFLRSVLSVYKMLLDTNQIFTLCTSASSSETSTALDDSTIEALSDNDLEQLSEKLLERVVRQLVTVAHTSEELLEELNSLDETGLSLLHYVSFYNYSQLVPVLVAHGAHINQQSTQGQTALHLAAGCGHDEVVDVLLQSGADLQVRDFDGLTAADRAEKSGHVDVAAKLHHHMGDNNSSDLVVVDEIYGFGGSPMEIDDAPTPYTDAGDMGLLAENDHVVSNVRPPRSHSNSCESPCESNLSSKVISYVSDRYLQTFYCVVLLTGIDVTSQVGENQEHNRKLLLGAFSTMSLHDKCALSLSISRDSVGHVARRRESSVGEEILINSPSSSTGTSAGFGSSPASMVGMDANLVGGRLVLSGTENDSDVQSVIAEDEEGLNKLQAAMELMGPEERQSLEDEVKVLQHGIRAWLLKRNCKNMRETTKQLREATQSIEDQQKQEAAEHNSLDLSERERAAVTVQAATRSMLARRSFLQTKHVAIKFQAATRGVLCRKNFARMKAHALASLVIQRNVREWWNKQPAATRIDKEADDQEQDTEGEKTPIPGDAYERALHDETQRSL
ncbi:Phosphoribosyltransferase-like [Phytophthora cactorum]|nr:Phosphoribosyltransferase-like [Phytophthora cactorum]